MIFEENFKDKGFEIVRNAISAELASFITSEFELLRRITYLAQNLDPYDDNVKFKFNDGMVNNCFGIYSPFAFETLSLHIMPLVERIVNKNLSQTYTYARKYYKGALLNPHKDKETCEYSVTICLQNDNKPWPIWFKNNAGQATCVELYPTDMIVYKALELEHWRESFEGEETTQGFLHYVDADGPFKEYSFDTRPYLGFPLTSRNYKDNED